jgi:hypothetical protein
MDPGRPRKRDRAQFNGGKRMSYKILDPCPTLGRLRVFAAVCLLLAIGSTANAQSIQIQAWIGGASRTMPYLGGGVDVQSGAARGSFALTWTGTHQAFSGTVTGMSQSGWSDTGAFGIQVAEIDVQLMGVYYPNYPSTTVRVISAMQIQFEQFKRPDGETCSFANWRVIGYNRLTGQEVPATVFIPATGFQPVCGSLDFYIAE